MPKNAEKENDRQEKPVELKIKYKMPVLCSVQSGQGYMPGQPAFLSALLTALSMSLLTQAPFLTASPIVLRSPPG